MLVSNIAIYIFTKFDEIQQRIDLCSVYQIIDYQREHSLALLFKKQTVTGN